MSIYKECDIRGVVGEGLTPAIAERIGRAVGTVMAGRTLVVAGDVRVSTALLKDALLGGLLQTPTEVLDAGTAPTPVLYDAIADHGADGGVMVTASHNPAQYNGFKLSLGPTPVTPEDIAGIADLVDSGAFAHGTGRVSSIDALERYLQRSLARLGRARGLRLVVDAGNGAAALVAPRLLRALGHDVLELACDIDGRFPSRSPNPAEPGVLHALQRRVRDEAADLGVAFDGDGDRAVFVDRNGRVASAEEALVVLARQLLAPGEAVVYDLKSSSVVAREIEALGGRTVIARSGHAFIRTSFLRERARLAGEVSGHFFFRELGYDDALHAAATMAYVLGRDQVDLADAVASLPQPVITPDLRVAWPLEGRDALLERVAAAYAGRPISRLDGVRVAFDDGWLLARKSVTEPAVTIRLESVDERSLAARRDELLAAVPELAGRHPYFS